MRALIPFCLFTSVSVVGCGPKSSNSSPQIVGGEKVTAANAKGPAYSSTVAISSQGAAAYGQSYCSGTLVDAKKNLVISAAHCFGNVRPGETHYVFFGSSLAQRSQGHLRKVTRLVVHREYNSALTLQGGRYSRPAHDIAMLRFEGEVPAGFGTAAMAQPSTTLPRSLLLAGFGTTGTLQRDALGRMRRDVNGFPMTHSDTGQLRQVDVVLKQLHSRGAVMEVIGATRKPEGACPGDSGGPVYGKPDGLTWYVYGVLSTGVVGAADTNGDGRADVGCVGENTYTDIRPYSAWLARAANLLSGQTR
jgi:secreted trypsin-like serine protease